MSAGVSHDILLQNKTQPQDVDWVKIDFYKGDERVRKLKVRNNGEYVKTITSNGKSSGYEWFWVGLDETSSLELEAKDLDSYEWISVSEV